MQNLGYANGWDYGQGKPEIVKKCEALGHKLEWSSNHERCLTTATCEVCQYVYKIDSSG